MFTPSLITSPYVLASLAGTGTTAALAFSSIPDMYLQALVGALTVAGVILGFMSKRRADEVKSLNNLIATQAGLIATLQVDIDAHKAREERMDQECKEHITRLEADHKQTMDRLHNKTNELMATTKHLSDAKALNAELAARTDFAPIQQFLVDWHTRQSETDTKIVGALDSVTNTLNVLADKIIKLVPPTEPAEPAADKPLEVRT